MALWRSALKLSSCLRPILGTTSLPTTTDVMNSWVYCWAGILSKPPGGANEKHIKSGYSGRRRIARMAAVPAPKECPTRTSLNSLVPLAGSFKTLQDHSWVSSSHVYYNFKSSAVHQLYSQVHDDEKNKKKKHLIHLKREKSSPWSKL